jgi:hypothetical protein
MTADNPMDIKIDVKASANLDSLIKATPKGLGRLFSLFFAKREADNARYTALLAAKTKIEYQKMIESGYDFEKDCLVPPQNSMLSENLNPLQIEERQETDNLAGNLRMTAEALKDVPDEEISDKQVDEDFFARWRREAKVIGSEDLQRLWGRLLAEEIKEPGGVSFRTLDILKNITSSEAMLFQRLSPYMCSLGIIVCNPEEESYPGNSTFDDMLLLSECGLVSNVDIVIYEDANSFVNIEKKKYSAASFGKFIVAADMYRGVLSIPGISLTSAGSLAFSICAHAKLGKKAIKYIADRIIEHNSTAIRRLVVYNKKNDSNYTACQPIYDSVSLT